MSLGPLRIVENKLIGLQTAFLRAQDLVDEVRGRSRVKDLIISDCASYRQGWFFYYVSESFLLTGKFEFNIGGNNPVFVSRDGAFCDFVPLLESEESFLERLGEV